jgi:hypothetical protein
LIAPSFLFFFARHTHFLLFSSDTMTSATRIMHCVQCPFSQMTPA